MTLTQKRYEAVMSRVSGTFTANELDDGTGFIEGRRIKFVLLDMIRDQLVRKDGDKYTLLSSSKAPVRPVEVPEVVDVSDNNTSYDLDAFKADLSAVMKGREPKSNKWWQTEIKKPVLTEASDPYEFLSDEELNFKAPAAPSRGSVDNTNVVPFDEALNNFGERYQENPTKVIQDLGTLFLAQAQTIKRQDKLIRELSAVTYELHRIVRNYVSGS